MCLAIPAKVVEFLEENFAQVEVGGVLKTVSLSLLDDVKLGDYVIVHVGFALSKLDPNEAEKSLELFKQIAEQNIPAASFDNSPLANPTEAQTNNRSI